MIGAHCRQTDPTMRWFPLRKAMFKPNSARHLSHTVLHGANVGKFLHSLNRGAFLFLTIFNLTYTSISEVISEVYYITFCIDVTVKPPTSKRTCFRCTYYLGSHFPPDPMLQFGSRQPGKTRYIRKDVTGIYDSNSRENMVQSWTERCQQRCAAMDQDLHRKESYFRIRDHDR